APEPTPGRKTKAARGRPLHGCGVQPYCDAAGVAGVAIVGADAASVAGAAAGAGAGSGAGAGAAAGAGAGAGSSVLPQAASVTAANRAARTSEFFMGLPFLRWNDAKSERDACGCA